MSLILLALAAVVEPAVPAVLTQPVAHPRELRAVIGAARASAIVLELFLDPDGRVLECAAFAEDLSEAARERICARAIGRDMGEGARDAAGTPVHGELVISRITGAFNQRLMDRIYPRTPDLEIFVAAMPGTEPRHKTGLTVLVDGEGHVIRCQYSREEDRDFAAVGCARSNVHTLPVRHGVDGAPVPYVGGLTIDFVREAAQSQQPS